MKIADGAVVWRNWLEEEIEGRVFCSDFHEAGYQVFYRAGSQGGGSYQRIGSRNLISRALQLALIGIGVPQTASQKHIMLAYSR